jgi:hypothetical protein
MIVIIKYIRYPMKYRLLLCEYQMGKKISLGTYGMNGGF